MVFTRPCLCMGQPLGAHALLDETARVPPPTRDRSWGIDGGLGPGQEESQLF